MTQILSDVEWERAKKIGSIINEAYYNSEIGGYTVELKYTHQFYFHGIPHQWLEHVHKFKLKRNERKVSWVWVRNINLLKN